MKLKNSAVNFWPLAILAGLIFGAMFFGLIFNVLVNNGLSRQIAEQKEAARPPKIAITLIQDSSCQECVSLSPLVSAIKAAGAEVEAETAIDANDPAGQKLISDYQITKIPTMVVKGELEKSSQLADLWKNLGEIADDVFVLRQVGAPYREIGSGQIRGKVKITLLADQDCSNCYDVMGHLQILFRFGLPIKEQEVLDIDSSAGKKLVRDYKIELAPTFLLSGDLEVYSALKSVWPQVGTVEPDGFYVFRAGVKTMGAYHDLETGQIITGS